MYNISRYIYILFEERKVVKKELLVGCTSSTAYDPAKALGVPTISLPTLYKLSDSPPLFMSEEAIARARKGFALTMRSVARNRDFVIVHGEMSAGMRAELEALFPPSPFNRFFKTE